MKLIFASTYHYPAHPAQFRHGLLMAEGYAKILKENFLYLVNFVKEPRILTGIQYREMNPHAFRRLRRARLLSLYLFFYFGVFFFRNSPWRGREVVIITQESKLAFLLVFWRMFFGYAVVYECHGLHSLFTDRYVCRHADAVVFVTKASEKEACGTYGPIKSHVIPNAVDTEDFDSARSRSKEELRRALNLPIHETLVGYVGRFMALGHDKGIEAGLRALKEISDKDIRFCFVGGTESEMQMFSQKAKELGVEDRAIFVPYQKDPKRVAEYTVAMDILMYAPPPIKFFMEETSPMKLYEYMAAGKPIVVSNFPAMREILSDDSAFFFKADSVEVFASTIRAVLTDTNEARRRSECARERIRSNTWLARGEKITTLARSLVV